jgi:acyl carrier protein
MLKHQNDRLKQPSLLVRRPKQLRAWSPVCYSSQQQRQPCSLEKDIRMALFHNSAGTTIESASGDNDVLKSILARARHDGPMLRDPTTATFLATEIGNKLFGFLLKPEEDLQITMPLSDLGMDSLVAIEMRSGWRTSFGFDMTMLEMLGMGTLEALGQHAAKGLLRSVPEEEETNGST